MKVETTNLRSQFHYLERASPSYMSQEQNIGVYFSASDKVYDWTMAFLNSFLTFNPNLRLILIPFNEQCDRILQLQTQYNFEVDVDPSFS